jgi:hypothetical protein
MSPSASAQIDRTAGENALVAQGAVGHGDLRVQRVHVADVNRADGGEVSFVRGSWRARTADLIRYSCPSAAGWNSVGCATRFRLITLEVIEPLPERMQEVLNGDILQFIRDT